MSRSNTILQSILVDLLDLGLQGKQAHWNVHGPFFRPIHIQLDELVEQLSDWQDEVAERIAALGGNPDGRATAIVATTKVAPLSAGALLDVDIVVAFTDRLTALSQSISARFADLEDDFVTQDLLIGIVAGLDKAAWFFRAQKA